MEEILVRDELVQSALQGNLPATPAMENVSGVGATVTAEFCYLQLRMICETIAVACLAAHGDIDAARASRVVKKREADWIVNALAALHPDFYPKPSKQVLNDSGRPVELVSTVGDFLSKEKLAELYREAGGFLHRGSFREVAQGRRPEPDFSRVKR